MTILHKDIQEVDMHEPKGVSTAADGKVCTADTNVSTWKFPVQSVCVDIADITIPGVYYIPFKYTSDVLSITSAIDGAITGADETITAAIGATPVTDGVVTVAYSGSAAGDYDIATPTAANSVTAGGTLKLTVAGTSTGPAAAHVVVEFRRTV